METIQKQEINSTHYSNTKGSRQCTGAQRPIRDGFCQSPTSQRDSLVQHLHTMSAGKILTTYFYLSFAERAGEGKESMNE